MSYRSFSPITGYTGHIPGDKWVIGTARRSQSWHRGKQGIGGGLGGGGGSGLMSGNGVGGSGLLMDVQDPLMEGIVRMDLDDGGGYKKAHKIGHRQKRKGQKDEVNVEQAKEVEWMRRREDERPETEEEGIDEEEAEEEEEEDERRRRRMNMRESLDKQSQRDLTDEHTEKEEEEAELEDEEDKEVEVKHQRKLPNHRQKSVATSASAASPGAASASASASLPSTARRSGKSRPTSIGEAESGTEAGAASSRTTTPAAKKAIIIKRSGMRRTEAAESVSSSRTESSGRMRRESQPRRRRRTMMRMSEGREEEEDEEEGDEPANGGGGGGEMSSLPNGLLPPAPSTPMAQGPTPRKAMDAFEDIKPGWWSEGQALKNLNAHKRALGAGGERRSEPTIHPVKMERELAASRRGVESAGLTMEEIVATPPPIGIMPPPLPHQAHLHFAADGHPQHGIMPLPYPLDKWDPDIPAPGYSGHLTELYQTSVGKSYGIAARESKRRQKHYQDELSSGGGTFLSSTDSSGVGKPRRSNKEMDEQRDGKISPY